MKEKDILIKVLILSIIATCFVQVGALSNAATDNPLGDLNNDLVINMNDVVILSSAFNTSSADSKYKPSYDLNNDGAINMNDVIIIAGNFGKKVAVETPTTTAKPTSTTKLTPTSTTKPTPTSTTKPTPTLATGTPKAGQWSYKSDTTNINIEKVQKGSGSSMITYYVADVQLSGGATILTASASANFGSGTAKVSKMATDNNAILAINGDYYNFRRDGFVIRNGTLFRDVFSGRDCLILKKDGTMEFAYEGDVSASSLLANGAYQVLSFGPILVKDGKIAKPFQNVKCDQGAAYLTNQAHPRTGIGMIEPNHFVFVVVDGRVPESEGILLEPFAQIFVDLGCKAAYNLDGGGSEEMYFNGKVVNNPNSAKGERPTSDIVYIKK